jgi:hypothetical protein
MGHTGRGGYIDVKPSEGGAASSGTASNDGSATEGSSVPNGQITAQIIADIIMRANTGHLSPE